MMMMDVDAERALAAGKPANPFRRLLFKPAPFTASRVHVVRAAHLTRRTNSVAEEPPLLEHFLHRAALQPYAAMLRDECPLPARCRVVFSQALHFEGMGGRREEETLLVDAADVDDARCDGPLALVVCTVVPSTEARRTYAERLEARPVGAAAGSGVNANDQPTVTGVRARGMKTLAERMAALSLTNEQRARLPPLRQALPGGADSVYAALAPADLTALEQLQFDAERSTMDELTRWRVATVVTQSYHLAMRVRGYARAEFVRLCGTRLLVRERAYYLVGNDVPARLIDDALRPPVELQRFEEAQRKEAVAQRAFGVPPVPLEGAHERSEDDDGDDRPASAQAAPPVLVLQPTAAPVLQAQPAKPVIVDNYRAPHLLDLLRTTLHMDTADEDQVDIEELEMSANHRLRVLGTMADLALADADATLEQLALTNQVSVEDREIAATYPHGKLAPRTARRDDAPGVRSFATPSAYAALGLGMLCVAVRAERALLDWLQYTEALLAARRMTQAEIREHLAGIVRFVAQTDEPDARTEPLVARLVDALRVKMRRHKVERVLQRIADDSAAAPEAPVELVESDNEIIL